MPGFRIVASALAERNLCLAQIAAVQLRVPDLPDRLARGGWDPAEHPRAGGPPNRGWFADKPTQVAQGEEDERAPEEMLDPTAPLRQAQWDAAIDTLRQIDPANPNLTYFSNPGSAPSRAALDRLDAVINEAETHRVMDKVMPDGAPIGQKGNDPSVRELPGGIQAAKDLFDYLRVGGRTQLENDKITVVQLPGNAGYVTFRPV